MDVLVDTEALRSIIAEAAKLAKQYRELTGKPLGITGEVGEYLAAELLGLKLTDARCPGFDVIAPDGRRIQVKTRCLPAEAKLSQRLGRIKLDCEWDSVMLVLINDDFEPTAIYEALRSEVERELKKPGSKARVRGALGVAKFISIAQPAWKREDVA